LGATATSPWSVQDATWLASVNTSGTAAQTLTQKGSDRFTQLILFINATLVSGTSPTLDVYLQTLLPDNTTWCDIAALTQMAATAKRVLSFVAGGNADFVQTDGTLAAATIKACPLGRQIRVKYKPGGTNPVWTLAISILLLQ
jgi:hypothetical protein